MILIFSVLNPTAWIVEYNRHGETSSRAIKHCCFIQFCIYIFSYIFQLLFLVQVLLEKKNLLHFFFPSVKVLVLSNQIIPSAASTLDGKGLTNDFLQVQCSNRIPFLTFNFWCHSLSSFPFLGFFIF